jgi:hypothetical protein
MDEQAVFTYELYDRETEQIVLAYPSKAGGDDGQEFFEFTTDGGEVIVFDNIGQEGNLFNDRYIPRLIDTKKSPNSLYDVVFPGEEVDEDRDIVESELVDDSVLEEDGDIIVTDPQE